MAVIGPTTITSTAGKVVRNKWFWIILVIIIILLVFRRHWNWLKAKLGRSYGDFTGQAIPEEKKGDLKSLSENIYEEIYATFGNPTKFIKEANKLNDDELLYLARYYKSALTRKTSLYTDVDDEYLPFTSEDEALMLRLSKLGLRK